MWVFSRRKFFSGHAEETRKIVSSRWNWRILEKSGKRYSLCNRTGTDREHSRQRWIRGRARDQQRSQHHLQLLMETDHISRLLARDLLMCHYEVVAKDTLPEVVSTEPSAFGCNTHDGDQPGDQLESLCTWTRSATTSTRTDKIRNTPSSQTLWMNIARSGRPTIIFSRPYIYRLWSILRRFHKQFLMCCVTLSICNLYIFLSIYSRFQAIFF